MSGNAAKGTRLSVLWGTGKRDGSRNSALWGKGGRTGVIAVVVASSVLALPWAAAAKHPAPAAKAPATDIFIPTALRTQAQERPAETFNVIVQGDGTDGAREVAEQVADAAAEATLAGTSTTTTTTTAAAHAEVERLADKILNEQVTERFSSITAVAATLTGDQITGLLEHSQDGLLSVTLDSAVRTSGLGNPRWSSTQLWPAGSGTAPTWKTDKHPKFTEDMPSIAIVDSGIQDRADFHDRLDGSRVLASVDLTSLPNNSAGDGRGHGTFVAGIAAGGLSGITGANPVANLVDVDVLNDDGMGLTSDVIRACQWILDHKDRYDIRVANFSLHSTITAPFYIDPLNRAVEQLWFNGITVVVAAGNYGSAAGPSGVVYSPADDPFVITVGAADANSAADPARATMAPWSAWGPTIDGFAKPDLAAPGRYMISSVPVGSTLTTDHPGNVVAAGYMQLSGTSFAAPVVSGAAASILNEHPGFTPDQVKGALMSTANALASSAGAAGGAGLIQVSDAVNEPSPPNPNVALSRYVTTGGEGGSFNFDAASWNSAAQANASWNSASWNSASWNSASWSSASWNSASWNTASWNSASWNSASWNSSSLESAAEGEAAPVSRETRTAVAVAARASRLAP